MKTGFKAGDLVKVKDDSWWLTKVSNLPSHDSAWQPCIGYGRPC